jgi:DNA-directed RNA polymerase alpha subunit
MESKIKDLKLEKLDLQFTLVTEKLSEANKLRRILLQEIETFAIEYVTFFENSSSRYDEVISLRLAQCVIDHEKIDLNAESIQGDLEVTGPALVTTSDIKVIPFTFETPIVQLANEQKLHCKVVAKKGTGKIHVKWRPVANISFKEHQDGFKFYVRLIGMMSHERLLRMALELLNS